MKKIFPIILLVFVCTQAGFAQSAYESAMKKGIDQSKIALMARSAPQLAATSTYFERIALTEKAQWLPGYYAALNNMLAAAIVMQTAQKEADGYLDKAMSQIEITNSLNKNESEILALKGQISYLKMAIDPMNRYQTYLPQAKAELDSALKLNPANPRVDYIQGSQLFYTPEEFGGGKAAAKPLLEKAMEKFKAFKPQTELYPSWGMDRCQSLLDATKK